MKCFNLKNLVSWLFLAKITALVISVIIVGSANAGILTKNVNCDSPHGLSVNQAIRISLKGGTVSVRGACIENVILNKGVNLVGLDGASIAPLDPNQPTILVTARDASILGLSIETSKPGNQIQVTDMALVTIDGNQIGNAEGVGVEVVGASLATLINNRIYGSDVGVQVIETATVRVGFKALNAGETFPNVIEANRIGMVVARAFATAAGNRIINNTDFGIVVSRNASTRIAANEIAGNRIGILNLANSTTELGLPGGSIFADPNFGVNTQLAFFCDSGYTSGSIGTFFPAIIQGTCESAQEP